MKSTNYYNTFIQVSDDCPVQRAEIPVERGSGKTAVNLQFELLIDNPYRFTSDDILFKIHALRKELEEAELEQEKEAFFSKGQACFRASTLAKRYGWGFHFNEEGRVALVGLGSQEYQFFRDNPNFTQLRAMRSKKA
ncbi:DUF6157 family protein [Pedobacter sp. SYSU D00535]|uniref:DUF6157 family protein n=1 Tax=Pedobacter sp. SYSU D00535 TaxID=2810308 RepID=UPI001A96229A|nr:DUF6157 family protein [Pedobacter sp. SYSU D00535]